MLIMILKMSTIVLSHVLLTVILWKIYRNKELSIGQRILIGVIYGCCGIFANHFSVNYGHSLLNVRDLSPLTAGLFFDPVSGIIAGFMAGIERYIIGTYFGIGSYTRLACSISTCLAGVLSAILTIFIFKRKKPSALYAFFMGAVVEVFHMYMVFVTHREDLIKALSIVKNHSGPMILFTGLGLMLESIALRVYAKEWENPFKKRPDSKIEVSQKFRFWMFLFTFIALVGNFFFNYSLQTRMAKVTADSTLEAGTLDIKSHYDHLIKVDGNTMSTIEFHVGNEGTFDIIKNGTRFVAGNHTPLLVPTYVKNALKGMESGEYFSFEYYGTMSRCRFEVLDENTTLLVTLPEHEIYDTRDTQAYETAFSNIIMMALLYVIISMLVQKIVVDNLEAVNASLGKITNGNLHEEVSVYDSSEFASLSDDINTMVDALKGYIDAAEKRVEQELVFAKGVQASALPKNFDLGRNDYEIYATMTPAKGVGGDFYDFFFVGPDKLALVMADVSGKGIPAALFMMRSKTAIRTVAEQGLSPSQIMEKANLALCEGNKEKMFVTAWIGIIDLKSGVMACANAGHEYPMLKTGDQDYDLFKDPHAPILGLMKKIKYKEYELVLKPGDALFVYTDGIPEAVSEDDTPFGLDRIKASLNAKKDAPMTDILNNVYDDIKKFAGSTEQFDDITMLGFRYLG